MTVLESGRRAKPSAQSGFLRIKKTPHSNPEAIFVIIAQFGCDAREIRTHDAFVVRYAAGAQEQVSLLFMYLFIIQHHLQSVCISSPYSYN
jgi:hypothetical protein